MSETETVKLVGGPLGGEEREVRTWAHEIRVPDPDKGNDPPEIAGPDEPVRIREISYKRQGREIFLYDGKRPRSEEETPLISDMPPEVQANVDGLRAMIQVAGKPAAASISYHLARRAYDYAKSRETREAADILFSLSALLNTILQQDLPDEEQQIEGGDDD